jgi:hypothetical protein
MRDPMTPLHERLKATLLFRLGLKLGQLRWISKFEGRDQDFATFLKNFEKAGQETDLEKALEDCIDLCNIDLNYAECTRSEDPDAALLLCSEPDSARWDRKLQDLVVLSDGTLS